RRRRGTRSPAHEGTGRAGALAAAVAAARRVARTGPLECPGRRRDAVDRAVAAAGPVDDHQDHAAHPAPERPGGQHFMSSPTPWAGPVWPALSRGPGVTVRAAARSGR